MPLSPLQPCAEPRCSVLVSHGRCATHARQREQARPNTDIRKLYHTARWRAVRQGLLSSAPLCTLCLQGQRVTPATDIDHVVPHRGELERFWDSGNLQPLCHPCHARKTQRGE